MTATLPEMKGPDVKGPEIKGWCPGALRPMQSGDGLLVRLRITAGRLSAQTATAIARAAGLYGNGQIDLSRRANLQLRGVQPETLEPLQQCLAALGLLDEDPDAEAVRNVLVSPFAGTSAVQLAKALEHVLATRPALHALPGKFGFAIDDDAGHLGTSAADITARQTTGGWQVILGTATPVACDVPQAAVIPVLASLGEVFAARHQADPHLRRMRGTDADSWPGFEPCTAETPQPPLPGSSFAGGVFIGLPFGRISAGQLEALGQAAHEIRLTPWRSLAVAAADAGAVLHLASSLGLVAAGDDPRAAIDACPGLGACPQALQDTRSIGEALANALAAAAVTADIHISGCAKGCARRLPAGFVLTGTADGFDLKRNTTAAGSKTAARCTPAEAVAAVLRLAGTGNIHDHL